MGLKQENIKVRVNNYNQEHFKSLGYKFAPNEFINIKVDELPKGSGLKIEVLCDYCNKPFYKAYRRYLETKDDLCCLDCRYSKVEKTNFARYGNKCTLRVDEFLNKSKETNIKKLGVEYPLQSIEIFKKCMETLSKNPDCINTSKQQLRIHSLYGGILNYNIGFYYVDIFFDKEEICFEYDGGGHNLRVKLNQITQKEFDKKEKHRILYLISKGYKIFKIVSSRDKLPSNCDLIKIKENAIKSLIKDGYNLYIYNVDEKSEKSFKM